MKTSFLMLVLVLMIPGFCLGEGPILEHIADPMALSFVATQSMDLWVDALGPWQFRAECPDGLRFLDQDGHLVQGGQITSGIGPRQSSHVLDVHIDLSVFAAGRHSLHLQVFLEGAQGILGLPIFPHTWILPLNSGKVQVERERGVVSIPSGQWFLLEPGDRLFYDQQEVFMFGLEPQSKATQVGQIPTDFWWAAESFNVETGDWGALKLNIQGPSLGGDLIFRSNPYLHMGTSWSLNGRTLACFRDAEGSLRIRIPILPPGVHELNGSVQALLSPPGGQGEIWALWQGREALCTVQIDRSWFNHDRVETLQVDTTSPLLLPSGRIHRMNGRGGVSVEGGELNVVIPLDDPTQPIWTGLPLAGSLPRSPHSKEQEESGDFVLPVFLWDQGLSWRLVTRSGPWFLDATAKRQNLYIQGQFGTTSVEISPSKQRALISSNLQRPQGDGGWYWWDTLDLRKGTYSQGKWLWTVHIPRQSGHMPVFGVQYRGENVGVRIGPEDVGLRVSSNTWAWGANLKAQRLWAETFRPPLRLEVSPQGVRFKYQHRGQGDLQVRWEVGCLHLEFKGELWEAYLKARSQGPLEGGLRYKKGSSKGRVLSNFNTALQIKNEMTFQETKGQLGHVLSPWCTLYVEGGVRTSFSWKEQLLRNDLIYGGGLILNPLPQVVAQVGWSNEQKWFVKAGVVVPIVGRKTLVDFE